jgi:hypothetical protein
VRTRRRPQEVGIGRVREVVGDVDLGTSVGRRREAGRSEGDLGTSKVDLGLGGRPRPWRSNSGEGREVTRSISPTSKGGWNPERSGGRGRGRPRIEGRPGRLRRRRPTHPGARCVPFRSLPFLSSYPNKRMLYWKPPTPTTQATTMTPRCLRAPVSAAHTASTMHAALGGWHCTVCALPRQQNQAVSGERCVAMKLSLCMNDVDVTHLKSALFTRHV